MNKINRINDKIEEIQQYLEKLDDVNPRDFERYSGNFKIRLMCERCLEIIIESLVDLAFLVIKEKSLPAPEDDKQAFDILKDAGIISEILAAKLKDAKGMRNILAHEYGKINDEIIFNAIEDMGNDTKEFINSVSEFFKEDF